MVQQNCSPACDVDDIETKSQKRAQKERIEKRINNLLKEAILLGNGSATKVGEDDSSSSESNLSNVFECMGECHGNPGVTTNFLSDDEQRRAALISVAAAGAGAALLA